MVTNKHRDVLLLKQHSDADAIVAEITVDGVKLIMASMYFDIGRSIEEDLSKIEAVLQHANGVVVLLATDSMLDRHHVTIQQQTPGAKH